MILVKVPLLTDEEGRGSDSLVEVRTADLAEKSVGMP